MDLLTSVVVELRADPDIIALVGQTDANVPWVFQDSVPMLVEGTGQCAIRVERRGGWTTPNRHNTARFPRVWVEVIADPDRDSDGNVTDNNARAKAETVLEAIFDRLHIAPSGESENWGTALDYIRVISCHAMDEPDFLRPDNSDKGMHGVQSYGLVVG